MFRLPLLGALATLVLAACTQAPDGPVPPNNIPIATTPAASATLVALTQAEDFDPGVLEAFTRETGVLVSVEQYADEEQALTVLDTRAVDLISADDRLLARLIADKRLAPLNANSLPGFSGIESRLKNLPFDPGNRYSVPFGWGTVGILYRTDQPRRFETWASLLDAARAASQSSKVALLDDPHPAFGAVAKSLGLSLNSTRSADWSAASSALTRVRSGVLIDSTAWSDALLTGEVIAAQAYSDDAVFALSASADLQFRNPGEGVMLWMRSLAIAESSAHPTEARRLIDYLCRPAIAARTVGQTYWLSPVPEAYNKMDGDMASMLRAATPDDAVFRRSEFVTVGADTRQMIERLWAEMNP